jgi:hypothetical protein
MLHHDVFAAYLSGLTTKKNEKEIWWEDEYGDKITVEPINEDSYILREYYENGQLEYRINYNHGKEI